MERSTVANRLNLSLIEDYYQRWLNDPSSVDGSWRIFFEGYDLGREPRGRLRRTGVDLDAARAQAAVTRLIDAYREFGHYLADLDPLKLKPRRAVARTSRAGGVRPDRSRPGPGLLQPAESRRVFAPCAS